MLEVNTNTEAEVSLVCMSSGNPQPSIIWVTKAGPLENCTGIEVVGEAEIDYSNYFQDFSGLGLLLPGSDEDFSATMIDSCQIQTSTSISPSGLNTTTSTLVIHNLYQEESVTIVCVADNGLPNVAMKPEAASISLVLDSEFMCFLSQNLLLCTHGHKACLTSLSASILPISFSLFLSLSVQSRVV